MRPVTYSIVEINERATRVLLTGCSEREAREIALRLASTDARARFYARLDGAA